MANKPVDQEPGTLAHRMANELQNAIADLEYMKPEKFDNEEHEGLWNEGLRAKRALLEEWEKAEKPEYTYEHLEAAACMWEHVLQRLRRARNPWSDYRDAYGACALREAVIRHAPTLEVEYQKAFANGYDKAFDWEYVPKYMEDHVTRILT